MHYTLFLSLCLMLAVCLLITLSQRLRIAYPILLVLGGLAVSFIPGLPNVAINPELIFSIFLPPLLCESAWGTSWKDFWRWRRIISFLAFGLVFLTSGIVAYVSKAFIPGFTLALGFLLGGIVSPPDAVAATSILRTMSLPRRVTAILEGESLINDASSLIVFQFALATVLSGTFVWHQAVTSFFMVTGVGIAVGLAVALVFYAIYRWLSISPSTHTVLTLVTPYMMYVVAEAVHASGVMAVVSGSLFLSYHSYRIFTPHNRLQATGTWNTVGFMLNGAVFMLIGLQLPMIVNALGGYSKLQAIGYGVLISVVVIVTRMVVALFASPFTHFISRFISVSDPNPRWHGSLILGYAGMRGVVSLAAALSIPLLTSDGHPFPERNLLLFITFTVILVTLVGQGLTLPALIRWVGFEDPDHLLPKHEQQAAVRQQLANAAMKRLEEQYASQTQSNAMVGRLKQQFELDTQVATYQLKGEVQDNTLALEAAEHHTILADLLHVQREELAQLRRREDYDDEVIRHWEEQLDLDEERLLMRGKAPLPVDSPVDSGEAAGLSESKDEAS